MMITRGRGMRALVWTVLLAGLALSLGPRPAWSQDVEAMIGDLPAGKSVTITFEVTINDPLPAGVTAVVNQGTVSGDNFTNVSTDDPDTSAPDDPTVTQVAIPSNPGDLNGDGDMNVFDLGVIVACFGQPASCNPDADFTGDGVIDGADISFWIANFCCS